ncbi:hypothetical protein NL676_010015 [Syzygium grande]|nr:hypothetical protein NL676_010015 [Syzygium grande]
MTAGKGSTPRRLADDAGAIVRTGNEVEAEEIHGIQLRRRIAPKPMATIRSGESLELGKNREVKLRRIASDDRCKWRWQWKREEKKEGRVGRRRWLCAKRISSPEKGSLEQFDVFPLLVD